MLYNNKFVLTVGHTELYVSLLPTLRVGDEDRDVSCKVKSDDS